MFNVRNPHSEEYSEDSLSPPPSKRESNVSDSSEDVDVPMLKMEDINVPCNVLVIGPKHSGKTTIIQNILMAIAKQIKPSATNCIFSADPRQYERLGLDDESWKIYRTYTEYDVDISQCNVRVVEDWKDKSIYTLFEDKNAINIISVDEYGYIPSESRRRVDYVILLGGIYNLRDVWFDLAGIVKDYSYFKKVYDECTSDYEFLVIDYFGSTSNWTEHVWWSKVNPIETIHPKGEDEDRRRSRSRARSLSPERNYNRSRSPSPRTRESSRYKSRSRSRSPRRSTYRSGYRSPSPRTRDFSRHTVSMKPSERVSTKSSVRDITSEVKRSVVLPEQQNIEPAPSPKPSTVVENELPIRNSTPISVDRQRAFTDTSIQMRPSEALDVGRVSSRAESRPRQSQAQPEAALQPQPEAAPQPQPEAALQPHPEVETKPENTSESGEPQEEECVIL